MGYSHEASFQICGASKAVCVQTRDQTAINSNWKRARYTEVRLIPSLPLVNVPKGPPPLWRLHWARSLCGSVYTASAIYAVTMLIRA
jgi:hypothetical protein